MTDYVVRADPSIPTYTVRHRAGLRWTRAATLVRVTEQPRIGSALLEITSAQLAALKADSQLLVVPADAGARTDEHRRQIAAADQRADGAARVRSGQVQPRTMLEQEAHEDLHIRR